ncbi:MAG TPA: UDP-N-acetylmuramoyl-tripeptide--D-alanyl-D-alanine ligase [Ignavibacteria bacterium]|nr:UDP-N-acetylmuramoyl-tripeptide--D-alanyl-D-alanine ligase [Ignavibacteria bacterium]
MLSTKDLIRIKHISEINILKSGIKNFNGVAIDSRAVKKNEIFFAIKGENTDGHIYLKDVFKKGVSTAVVNDDWFRKNGKKFRGKSFLTVRDTTDALGEFAKIHKGNFNIPVLCIGGSNGKTTTKDLVAAVLSQKYMILKSEGNFNNHIGLPLTLLRLKKSHEMCVLEVGCNHFGEIKYLCGIAEPGFGLITNIGKEHLEFFKTVEGVAKAEFELYDYLKKKEDGILFMNYDDKYINKYSGGIKNEKKFSYSYKFNTDVKGRFAGYSNDFEPAIEVSFGENSKCKKFKTLISTFGKHSVYNGLAAAAAGIYFKVSPAKIKKALRNFKPASSKRMEVIRKNGMTIINDAYNSNPESVKMGIETMMEYRSKGNKYAVLSDMLELGKVSGKEHLEIGKFAVKAGLKNLFTYGKESKQTFTGASEIRNNLYFENKEDLIEVLRRNIKKDDVIYVKGSRGMKMEEVVNEIIKT